MKRVGLAIGLVASGTLLILGRAPLAASVPGPGDPVKGQQVYAAQKCGLCHKIGETGSKIGPDLSVLGTKRDAAWLAKYLPNPITIDPKNPPKIKMTPTKAKGQDLDDLIAYLLTLKGKK